MTKRSARGRVATLAALLLAALAWLAVPATAEVYTVKLTNGKSFLTRYQPREAAFDPAMVTFLGEHGNLMAVPRDQIEGVTTEVESKGYGLRINTTTVLLGYTANNGEIQGDQVFVSGDDRNAYDIQQFVEPSQAGGGFPVYGVQNNSNGPVLGGGGGLTPSTSQPSASPPPAQTPPSGTVQ
jgi:hypothetical protein